MNVGPRTVGAAKLERCEDDGCQYEYRDDCRLVAKREAVDDVGRRSSLARHRHLNRVQYDDKHRSISIKKTSHLNL